MLLFASELTKVPSSQNQLNLDHPPQDLRKQALMAMQQGCYFQAIALMNLAIGHDPSCAADYNNRGLIHFQAGQLEQALTDYDMAIALNPNLDAAYNNRGSYYIAQGQIWEALQDYDRAIDINPGNFRAQLNLGTTYRDLGFYSQAIERFEQGLQLVSYFLRSQSEQASTKAHLYTARGRAQELMGDWNYAVADYQRSLDELELSIVCATDNVLSPLDRQLYQQTRLWLQTLLLKTTDVDPI
jgi:tetratricopeptide (TPR) repeat protein